MQKTKSKSFEPAKKIADAIAEATGFEVSHEALDETGGCFFIHDRNDCDNYQVSYNAEIIRMIKYDITEIVIDVKPEKP